MVGNDATVDKTREVISGASEKETQRLRTRYNLGLDSPSSFSSDAVAAS
jgi:hypothetical protein